MTNFDYYAVARDLIARLYDAGRTADAAKLQSAIDEGSTGSEILMALRFYLLEIGQKTPFEGESQLLAALLISELNKVLE